MPKPKPFKRPSIEVGSSHGRVWKWVSPETLQEGDTVADFGIVAQVVVRMFPQSTSSLIVDDIESGVNQIDYIDVVGLSGKRRIFSPTDSVHAFVKER